MPRIPEGTIWPPLVRDDDLQNALRDLVIVEIDGGSLREHENAMDVLMDHVRDRANVARGCGYER